MNRRLFTTSFFRMGGYSALALTTGLLTCALLQAEPPERPAPNVPLPYGPPAPDFYEAFVAPESSPFWDGLRCRIVDPALRKQLHLDEDQGTVVTFVEPESPGAKAGVEIHDILLSFGGSPLIDERTLNRLIRSSDGKEGELTLLRAGKELSVNLTPEKRGDRIARPPRRVDDVGIDGGEYWLGLVCRPTEAAMRKQLGLEEHHGVIIADVAPGGPGAKAGIERYDILLEFGDAQLTDARNLSKKIDESEGKQMPLKLLRGGKEITLKITPEERPDRRPHRGDGYPRSFGERHVRPGDYGNLQYAWAGLGPGIVVRPLDRKSIDFPDDFHFSLTKEGNKPAKIEARLGDKSWTVTENDLSELPENLRTSLESWLGRGVLLADDDGDDGNIPLVWRPQGLPGGPHAPPPPHGAPHPRADAFDDAGGPPPPHVQIGPHPPGPRGDRGPGKGGPRPPGPPPGPPHDERHDHDARRAIDQALRFLEQAEARQQRQSEAIHKRLDEISRQLESLQEKNSTDDRE